MADQQPTAPEPTGKVTNAEKSALFCCAALFFMSIACLAILVDPKVLPINRDTPIEFKIGVPLLCSFVCLISGGWFSLEQFRQVFGWISKIKISFGDDK